MQVHNTGSNIHEINSDNLSLNDTFVNRGGTVPLLGDSLRSGGGSFEYAAHGERSPGVGQPRGITTGWPPV